jgi:predicted small secreted protein
MKSKKAAALFAIFLILASLLFTSCATKQGGAQVQPPTTTRASLIVVDSSGNALPIVFSFSREVNGVKYYSSDGKELTREEILSSLKAQGMTVEEVSEIWGTSIADVFALFTPAQLYERNSHGAATNATLLYDMWECLTTGPPEIRENPRAILEGLVPNIDMRGKVFDFLEQRKRSSFSY